MPDVLEDRPLLDVAIVRAEREPDEHLITEADVRDFGGREWLAELRGRQNVGLALALDLNDVRAFDRDSTCSVIAPLVRRNCSEVRPSPWTTPST